MAYGSSGKMWQRNIVMAWQQQRAIIAGIICNGGWGNLIGVSSIVNNVRRALAYVAWRHRKRHALGVAAAAAMAAACISISSASIMA